MLGPEEEVNYQLTFVQMEGLTLLFGGQMESPELL